MVWEKNAKGGNSEYADTCTKRRKFGEDTGAIKWYRGDYCGVDLTQSPPKGIPATAENPGIKMLPPAQIEARALRWTVKLFLSHFHEVGSAIMGRPLIKPWVIEHGGHVHYIAPPNWPMKESE